MKWFSAVKICQHNHLRQNMLCYHHFEQGSVIFTSLLASDRTVFIWNCSVVFPGSCLKGVSLPHKFETTFKILWNQEIYATQTTPYGLRAAVSCCGLAIAGYGPIFQDCLTDVRCYWSNPDEWGEIIVSPLNSTENWWHNQNKFKYNTAVCILHEIYCNCTNLSDNAIVYMTFCDTFIYNIQDWDPESISVGAYQPGVHCRDYQHGGRRLMLLSHLSRWRPLEAVSKQGIYSVF